MQNIIKKLLISTLALASLTLSAVAQQQPQGDQGKTNVEQPVTTVVETLQLRQTPQQPLITQEDIRQDQARVERPRGESRTARDKQNRTLEKPLVEVTGF